jgi:hypothetical protein
MANNIKIFPLTSNPISSNKEPIRRPLPQKSDQPPIEKQPKETETQKTKE